VNAQLNVGLKAHWTFGAGSTADISGNGHDGTVLGNVTTTTDRDGNPGCAMLFPGDTSEISVPFSSDFDIAPTAAFTVSLWYQGGSVAPGDLEWLFAKRTASNGIYSNDYAVSLYDLNRVLGTLGGNGDLWSPVMPPVPDAQWHHVAYVYDNGVQQIWQDDILQAWDSTQQVLVGQSGQGIIIGEHFQGAIDDIRFYDRDLTTAEIGLLYQEPASCSIMGIAEPVAPPSPLLPIRPQARSPSTSVLWRRERCINWNCSMPRAVPCSGPVPQAPPSPCIWSICPRAFTCCVAARERTP
jgi:hypothetical protein